MILCNSLHFPVKPQAKSLSSQLDRCIYSTVAETFLSDLMVENGKKKSIVNIFGHKHVTITSVPICLQYNFLQNLFHLALTRVIQNKDLLLTSTLGIKMVEEHISSSGEEKSEDYNIWLSSGTHRQPPHLGQTLITVTYDGRSPISWFP